MGWLVRIAGYTPAPGCPTLLEGFTFELEPGEVTHVCGPSGCGKSTLLAVLAGELPRHNGDDSLEADLGGFPCERARRTCQDPSMELACATVVDELLLEPEYREPAWEAALERALQTAAAARLGDWLALPVPWLSYGQARLVGLASMLQYPPPAVLLDEPFAGLDEQGRAQVELAIARVAAAGSAVVVTHTRTVEASRVVFLAQAEPLPAPPLPVDVAPAVSGGLLARGLGWCGWAGSPGLDLRLDAGRLLLVTGPNGSGKTQLLMCLAGLRPPRSGDLRLTGSAAFVPQNPDQELSASKLLDQLTLGERRLEKSAVVLASWFGLDCAAAPTPFAMSFGEKRRICLVGALLRRPSVLLLDEPLNGLDATHRLRLLAALQAFVDGGGSAIVATHEPEPFAPLAPANLRLDPANRTVPWSLGACHAGGHQGCTPSCLSGALLPNPHPGRSSPRDPPMAGETLASACRQASTEVPARPRSVQSVPGPGPGAGPGRGPGTASPAGIEVRRGPLEDMLPCSRRSRGGTPMAELLLAKIVEPREDSGGVSYSLQSTAYSLSAGGARAVFSTRTVVVGWLLAGSALLTPTLPAEPAPGCLAVELPGNRITLEWPGEPGPECVLHPPWEPPAAASPPVLPPPATDEAMALPAEAPVQVATLVPVPRRKRPTPRARPVAPPPAARRGRPSTPPPAAVPQASPPVQPASGGSLPRRTPAPLAGRTPAFTPAPPRFETYLAAILRRLQTARTYPREARRLGLEGTVGLAFSIELDGSASRIEVVPGAVPVLADAARRLVADRPLLPPPAGWSPAARVRLVLTYLLE